MVEKEIPAVAAENAVHDLVTNQPSRILSMVPTLRDPTALLNGAISPAENSAHGLARYAEKLGDAANIRTPYYDRDFNNAIKQFSASRDGRVKSFAEAAQSSMGAGNQKEAELALSFAEVLTRLNGISKAYRSQDWAKTFVEFADSMNGGVPKERAADALTALHDADSSISNARRSDAMDSLSKSNNQFVKKELDDIRGMFSEGRDKDADMALAFLSRYNSAYNRKDAISDGAADTRAAVEMAIRGDAGAEKKFQDAVASYTLGKICVQVGAKLSEYRDELLSIDKEGKQAKLRDLLNDAETSIGRRDPDSAVKKMNEFVAGMNSMKADMALGRAEDRLLEVHNLLEQFRKQLALVPSDTPHSGAVLKRLEDIDSEVSGLRDLVAGVRKGTGSAAELETKLKTFSARWDEFSSFYSVSKLVLDELAKTRRFEAYVRNSENMDHSINKSAALTHLSDANDHLQGIIAQTRV